MMEIGPLGADSTSAMWNTRCHVYESSICDFHTVFEETGRGALTRIVHQGRTPPCGVRMQEERSPLEEVLHGFTEPHTLQHINHATPHLPRRLLLHILHSLCTPFIRSCVQGYRGTSPLRNRNPLSVGLCLGPYGAPWGGGCFL